MNRIVPACGVVLLMALAGCETTQTSDQQVANARRKSQKVPFENRPALYASLAQKGKLSPEAATLLRREWERTDAAIRNQERAKVEAHRKLLASMTPAQRAAYELQLQQIALQQEANELQRQGNVNANLNAALQRSQATIQANNQILSNLATSYRQNPVIPPPYVAPQFKPLRNW